MTLRVVGAGWRRVGGRILLLVGVAGCGGSAPEPPVARDGPQAGAAGEEARLQARVAALRDSLRRRGVGDDLPPASEIDGDILIGLRTDLAREIAAWMAGTYLDRVQLHLEPDIVVRHEARVRTRVGPIAVTAGLWRVEVTIRSIRASLRAGSVRLAPLDANRIGAVVGVSSEGGYGEAEVGFRWDAAAVPSLVCEDFAVEERFSGTVPPSAYRVSGTVTLEAVAAGIQAVPDFSESPIRVSPEPTAESWARIRSILRSAESGCGPLDPDEVIGKLRDVFARGFEFRLPESIFRPLLLPTRIRDRIEVGDRSVDIAATPTGLRIRDDVMWYGVALEATGDVATDRRAP